MSNDPVVPRTDVERQSSGGRRPPFGRLLGLLVPGLMLIGAAVAFRSRVDENRNDLVMPEPATELIESEGLILALTPELNGPLRTSVYNLAAPGPVAAHLFSHTVQYRGLDPHHAAHLKDDITDVGIQKFAWDLVASGESRSVETLRLFEPLLSTVDSVEMCKFYFVRGRLPDQSTFVADVGFEARCRLPDGHYAYVKSAHTVTWVRDTAQSATAVDHRTGTLDGDDPNGGVWKIAQWHMESFETMSAGQLLFDEAVDSTIPDKSLRSRLLTSRHEQFILQKYQALLEAASRKDASGGVAAAADEAANGLEPEQAIGSAIDATDDAVDPDIELQRIAVPGEGGRERDAPPGVEWAAPHPDFSEVAQDQHPGLSVVDIDADGFDDLYVMSRWGRNVLLKNDAGRQFTDIAPDVGLDLDSHCSTAAFADFDNDGDLDVMIGRTYVPSVYLVNEDGRFVDRSKELVTVPLPALTSAISVVDYNRDGLLDIYISTYAAKLMRDEDRARDGTPDACLHRYLPPDTAQRLAELRNGGDFHRYLNNIGPPNVLLVNRGGGRFEPAPESESVAAWRHTFQATWGDYDADGDPDLYLANDFAVNCLMRNDGDAGFVDVAETTNTTDIGFGMGADWGDYDNDGRQDLYVSNMFSKAGQRITSQLGEIDNRFARMAGGNSLFRQEGDRFRKVSGLTAPALQVEKAGWSWSSQFADFDNDGWLDIHALSGYYSAPREVAVAVDL